MRERESHARISTNSPKYAEIERLNGGQRRIRTPETRSHSMEGILPSSGHYAASKKAAVLKRIYYQPGFGSS
jgi:hypothetical protein